MKSIHKRMMLMCAVSLICAAVTTNLTQNSRSAIHRVEQYAPEVVSGIVYDDWLVETHGGFHGDGDTQGKNRLSADSHLSSWNLDAESDTKLSRAGVLDLNNLVSYDDQTQNAIFCLRGSGLQMSGAQPVRSIPTH